jgi:hypothetical protein
MLTVAQILSKFTAFYGTRSFTVVFRRHHNLSPSRDKHIQSKRSCPIFKIHFNNELYCFLAYNAVSEEYITSIFRIESRARYERENRFLIMSSHLRLHLPGDLFPSNCCTKNMYRVSSLLCVLHALSILRGLELHTNGYIFIVR